MTYCQNCGLIIETFDCPICGHRNYRAPPPPDEPTGPQAIPVGAGKSPAGRNGTARNEGAARRNWSAPRSGSNGRRNGRSNLLAIGGLGAIIMGLAATFLAIIPLYGIMDGEFMRFESDLTYVFIIFSTLLFVTGCALQGLGLYGLYRYYGSYIGLVAMIFSILAPVILAVITLGAIESYTWGSYSYVTTAYDVHGTLWVGHLYVGIMFFITGLAWRRLDYRLGWDQPNLTVGNLYLISAILFLLFFGFAGIPWVIISATAMCAGVLFLIAKPGIEPPLATWEAPGQ
jgi:hypothetical protein